MNEKQIVDNVQEQAVAAWVDYLNRQRIETLLKQLEQNSKDFESAVAELDKTIDTIVNKIVERNRGGIDGMHGYIAEVAEAGVGNARKLIEGKEGVYKWLDNNGPVDLVREGINIQQKFVNSGGHYSLDAIAKHLKAYPDYLANDGVYQIPADHYETVKRLWEMSEEEALKLAKANGAPSYKQWKYVHDYLENGPIGFDDIEPSALGYKDVQAGQIGKTINAEEARLKQVKDGRDAAAEAAHKPNLKQGAQAVAVGAILDGTTSAIMTIVEIRKSGKQLRDFTNDDWVEVAKQGGAGTGKGAIRGGAVYVLSNLRPKGVSGAQAGVISSANASAIVSAGFAVAEQAYMLRQGKISEADFVMNSEMVCLDAAANALFATIGQAVIPVPILGAVIGSAVGSLMWEFAKDNLNEREQELIKHYADEQAAIDERYSESINMLNEDLAIYMDILVRTFQPDPLKAFVGSVELAKNVGVPTEEILDTPEKAYHYFMD